MKKKIKEFSRDELVALVCGQHIYCKECPLHIKDEICYLDCLKIGEEEIEMEQSNSSDEAFKVIEILNNQPYINIFLIKRSANLEQYNGWAVGRIKQEEYDLLRRFFK